MLQIALCDDMVSDLATICTYTKEYLEAHKLDAEIYQFTNPDKLLRSCEKHRYQIYILDIVMPVINGIEVGKEIRQSDQDAQIIYTTTEPSFALDAYSANPINYLLKPIDKGHFFNTLALAISKTEMEEGHNITIKTHNGLQVVALSAIVCCEYVKRSATYRLTGGETITTLTLQCSFTEHVMPLLNDKRFLQPHKAFVLNMSRVTAFSKERFTLRNGITVPISIKQYSIARNRYMDYLLTREGVF